MIKRHIVIGDVHGCFDELVELVCLVGYRPGVDEIIGTGDLMDRGPDPVGVVRFFRTQGFKLVNSNHDEKHARFRRHEKRVVEQKGYKNPMNMKGIRREQNATLSEDDVRFLDRLPSIYRPIPGWVVVHAGFAGDRPIDEQPFDRIIRMRFVNPDGSDAHDRPHDPIGNRVPWPERYNGPESVVYGHSVWSMNYPRIDARPNGVRCIGVDTGCCFGGKLSAFVIETGEVFQVAAKKEYVRHKDTDDERRQRDE